MHYAPLVSVEAASEPAVRPHDVRRDEGPRLEDRAVHVGLRREVDDPFAPADHLSDSPRIAHIPLDELDLPGIEEVPDVFHVPRVRELVEHEDVVALPNREAGEVRADEAGPPRDEGSHVPGVTEDA